MYLLVIKQLSTMMAITVLGFIFAKIVKINDNQQKLISMLLLYFINPCLIINSFNVEFDSQKLVQLLFVVLMAFLVHGIMILVGIISSKEKLDRLGAVFTNCGFVGIPLIRGVFGDEGVFYLMGYLIVFNILLWTYGYYQICGSCNFKKIITNPNIISVILGLIIFCLPFTLPEIVIKPITMIGDLNTATAMILLGVLFARFEYDKSYTVRIIKFTFIRLVLCAIVSILFLWGMYKIFGGLADCRMMIFVVLICSFCPAGTSIPSFAVVYDGDKSYASLIVSVTSLVCILTIPAFVALAELIIK